MKISIEGFLSLREIMGGRTVVELDSNDTTLMEVLNEIAVIYGKRMAEILFEENSINLNRNIRVMVNGRHYSHLPQKLNTVIKEGDAVCLFPPVAGG